MQRCDHHDWASEAYVDEWVRRQRAEDSRRAERFQLMCDLLPSSPMPPSRFSTLARGMDR